MEIQKIIFPEIGRCEEETLFFRAGKDSDFAYDKKQITFQKGASVSFDTYFNGLSIEKWAKYTKVQNISLKVTVKGKFQIRLVRKELRQNEIFTDVIQTVEIGTEKKDDFFLEYGSCDKKGMYTFEIKSLEDEGVFYGGSYETEMEPSLLADVKIGIAICTYRREAFIEKNIEILNRYILQNEDSPLNKHLEIVIADNGKTLDIEKLGGEYIHINPNRNLGGAGGFTRDLIEMMHHKEYGITHALLMDDDIVIEPEAIVKTYTILTLLKEEYRDAFIGGAMLRLDQPSIQVEAGASWNGGYFKSLKANQNMVELASCLENEQEEYSEYNAWWYCCFPMEIVKQDNLPLPLFIRGDDVEYGLRNMKHLIVMNGICVWHEPFENKYSSFLEYYIIRNQLIDNAFHCTWYGPAKLIRSILGRCLREVFVYRYKNIDLYLRGVNDFLKGPEWFMQQDGEKLHQDITASGYKFQPLEELDMKFDLEEYEKSKEQNDSTAGKVIHTILLNGLFFPTNKNRIVPVMHAKACLAFRVKRVMQYDEISGKAFVTEKSIGKSLSCIFHSLGMSIKVLFRLKSVQKKYRKDGLKLRTLEFWTKYLELEKNETFIGV